MQGSESLQAALEPHFTVRPRTDGTVEDTYRFDASNSVGSIAKFQWNFGDGDNGAGVNDAHKYRRAGTYTVTLTIVASGGAKASLNKRVIVSLAGGGGGGGGGNPIGSPELCQGNNFRGQRFRVEAVSGNTITTSITLATCPNRCGEIRRNDIGILEFVGDTKSLNGKLLTIDPGGLPDKCAPKRGETLKSIWKHC